MNRNCAAYFNQFTTNILFIQLLLPIPLIIVGVLRWLNPVLVGVAVALAILPWLIRWLFLSLETRSTSMDGPLILLFISSFVGLWASYDPSLSWPIILTMIGSVSLLYAIVNARLPPERIAGGLVVFGTLFALYFVSQYGYFDYPLETGRLAQLGRLTGALLPGFVFFTPHPNAAAGFMESVFLLGLVLAWQSRGISRGIWGVVASLIAYGLLISASRGSFVGLAVALVIWLILLIPHRLIKFSLVAGVLGLMLFGLVIVYGWPEGSPLYSNFASLKYTIHTRLSLYDNSINLARDYLFTGIGLGDPFALVYSRYQLLIGVPYLYYTHNLFLAMGLGNGVLGLLALLCLLFGFYIFVIKVERAGLSGSRQALFRAAWLGATITFVHGLTDSPQLAGSGWPMPMMFAIWGLTFLTGYSVLSQSQDQPAERPLKQWHVKIWIAIVVIGMIIIFAFWQTILSYWYANLGAVYQTWATLSPSLTDFSRQEGSEQAVVYFAQALELNSAQPTANRRLGLMALDRAEYTVAANYLEKAYQVEPGNQATLTALGLTYVWSGQLDLAENLLRRVDNRWHPLEILENWRLWWRIRGRTDLAGYAEEMIHRLRQN